MNREENDMLAFQEANMNDLIICDELDGEDISPEQQREMADTWFYKKIGQEDKGKS